MRRSLHRSSLLAAPSAGSAGGGRGALPAEGAFTCDFAIPASLIADQTHPIAGMLERDRMYMSARPGFFNKHTLMRPDASGNLLIGGRYLFASRDQAQDYSNWVENEFVLDGTRFWDRPYFLGPECHVWNAIGAHEFGDVDTTHVVARTERWTVPADNQRALLADRWPAIRDEAAARGLTAVWLLYAKQEQLVSLVYFADRIVPKDPFLPDFASLGALESAQPLGRAFDDQSWTRDGRSHAVGLHDLVSVRPRRPRPSLGMAELAAVSRAVRGGRSLRAKPGRERPDGPDRLRTHLRRRRRAARARTTTTAPATSGSSRSDCG